MTTPNRERFSPAAHRAQRRAEPAQEERADDRATPRKAAPRIGVIPALQVEIGFAWLLYAIVLALALLSIVGTFYGLLSKAAPITSGAALWSDMNTNGTLLAVAAGIQIVLSLLQYGARVKAKKDPRWWLLYLAALGVSVYYNLISYYTPLVATTAIPPFGIVPLIVAGDVLPEFIIIRR